MPFFIRTGKRLPVTQTELRARLPPPAAPGLHASTATAGPSPTSSSSSSTPSTGTQLLLDAHRADAAGPEEIALDMEFAQEGGEAPTPYEVLLSDAMRGDSARFTRQDGVEEAWRIFQPLLDRAGRRCTPTRRARWGPQDAEELIAGFGRWHGPWIVS